MDILILLTRFNTFFGELECVGHSVAYVAHVYLYFWEILIRELPQQAGTLPDSLN